MWIKQAKNHTEENELDQWTMERKITDDKNRHQTNETSKKNGQSKLIE